MEGPSEKKFERESTRENIWTNKQLTGLMEIIVILSQNENGIIYDESERLKDGKGQVESKINSKMYDREDYDILLKTLDTVIAY